MPLRHLVLFARDPRREARAKGFAAAEAAEVFAAFACGWAEAARATGARLVLATPREDVAAWRAAARGATPDGWIVQSGGTFGDRLQSVAASAARLGGHVVIVGGDVVPSAAPLADAFAALEAGSDAVLGAASDGGVSLLSLAAPDFDLLRSMALRRGDVFSRLARALAARRRRVAVIGALPDVDSPACLRRALRLSAFSILLRSVLRRALDRPRFARPRRSASRRPALRAPASLRAPPA